ncbi:hypothetical protein FRC04_005640 [Tulasnella sp. 424]|nr:hypothetical protein FRC04_005640 [Tulasnella sp. 424]
MAPTQELPDANLSVPIPTDSIIRTQIHPHHMPSNLPYDIFLMIAFLCWDRESDARDSNFPITASHVCRMWRRYALDTGAFWTTLEFRQQNPHRAIMKYKTWLERSKSSPLDIIIRSEPFKGASVKHAKSIMRLIMPRIGHWRSFQVERVPTKIFRLIFDRLRDASAPKLEILTVVEEQFPRSFRSGPTTRWKLMPFVHGEKPSLKELIFKGVPYGDLLKCLSMLEVLHLVDPGFYHAGAVENVKSIHRILLYLPSLRALRIDCGRRITNMFFEPLRLLPGAPSSPFLNGTLADQNMLLGLLNLPKVLYFLTQPHLETTLNLGLLPLLSEYHPFPNLISLPLGGTHSPFPGLGDSLNKSHLAQLEGALSGLPQLKALTFHYVDFEGDKGLPCLETTCPRLHWLTFIQCTGCTQEALQRIVETRRTRPGFNPLGQLDIQQSSSLDGIVIDKEIDMWMKRSLTYKVGNLVHEPERGNLEGVKPAKLFQTKPGRMHSPLDLLRAGLPDDAAPGYLARTRGGTLNW